EVKIRIDDEDSKKVNTLTNMQVQVAIDTAEKSAAYPPPKLVEPISDSSIRDVYPSQSDLNRQNLNPIYLLSIGVGIFGVIGFTKLFRAKSLASSSKDDTTNNLLSDRQTLYLPETVNSVSDRLDEIEQLRARLYHKARAKQIAIATAEVELKQTQAEYLEETSKSKTEIFNSDRLNYLKQKLLLVQNTLVQQESQLDREIADLQNQIAQAKSSL
ncbi:MAG: hypothetical protein AAFV28_08750, partial [Cyanobacteria bacterium J06635_13]